jgi:hypothetical protein
LAQLVIASAPDFVDSKRAHGCFCFVVHEGEAGTNGDVPPYRHLTVNNRGRGGHARSDNQARDREGEGRGPGLSRVSDVPSHDMSRDVLNCPASP